MENWQQWAEAHNCEEDWEELTSAWVRTHSQLSQSALRPSSSPLSSSSESAATFFILIMAALMLRSSSLSPPLGTSARAGTTYATAKKYSSHFKLAPAVKSVISTKKVANNIIVESYITMTPLG